MGSLRFENRVQDLLESLGGQERRFKLNKALPV